MTLSERVARTVVSRSRAILVGLLVATLVLGAGIPALEDDTSLERYEGDSPEVEALDYAAGNFTAYETNVTRTQLVVTGDDVLSRESMVATLELQRQIREDESISATLVDRRAVVGVENVLATSLARERKAERLAERAAELERRGAALNATGERLEAALNETRRIQREYEGLNASYERGEISPAEYTFRSQELEAALDDVFENATADLDANETARFERAMGNARSLEREFVALERAYDDGELSEAEYEARRSQLRRDADAIYADGTIGVLGPAYEELQEARTELERERRRLASPEQPPIEDQIAALESLNESEYEAALASLLSGEGGPGGELALRMLPTSYEPGTTSAEARAIVVTQRAGDGVSGGRTDVDERTADAQLEIRELATTDPETVAVVGSAIVRDEMDRAMGDSLAFVSPLALLFVVAALGIAYRDPLDIVLGVAGVLVVLVWTFGFVGWAGIPFDVLLVAVPVLLIGLSIDYGIHVFMRHRERRGADGPDDVRGSMAVALAGVGVALVWVTATTAIGFLSNLASPIDPIRSFGFVNAVGIGAALIVFGAAVPAAKVELDAALERRGYDRERRAFGTGDGRLADALSVGYVAARRAPLAVLLLVALVTAGGVYGAAQVDTTFDESDFLADEPPAWSDRLPAPIRPGDYRLKSDLETAERHFPLEGARAQVVVRGDVTDGDTLGRLARSQREAGESDVAHTLPTGEADVRSPITVMEAAAAENESFNASFTLADRDGDGVPDQNLEGLYDQLFEIDPRGASEVIHRTDDGEYEGVRLVVGVDGDASPAETTSEMRDAAAAFGAGSGREGGDGSAGDDSSGRWDVVATGSPVVTHVVERNLFRSVLWSFAVSLVAVFAFLTIAFRATGGSASLGAVTLLPVALSVSWILGTMALVGIPFNVMTGTITSLTIGLGVAYSIHVSTRFRLELDRQGGLWEPLYATLTGTGGALLGSAATTVGGFGVLAFAFLPTLRQFGVITALTVAYAFLASVLVLPTVLVCWRCYTAPADVHDGLEVESPFLEAVRERTPDGPATGGRTIAVPSLEALREPDVGIPSVNVPSLPRLRGRDGEAFSFETLGSRDLERPSFDTGRYRDALSSLGDAGRRIVDGVKPTEGGGPGVDRTDEPGADRRGQIVVRGEVTDPAALAAVAEIETEVGAVEGAEVDAAGDLAVGARSGTGPAAAVGTRADARGSNGSDVRGPVGALSELAGRDETIARALIASDLDGDGLPETDVERLYDLAFEVDEAVANEVLYRSGRGEYAAVRVTVPLAGETAAESRLREFAREICDDGRDARLEASVSIVEEPIGDRDERSAT